MKVGWVRALVAACLVGASLLVAACAAGASRSTPPGTASGAPSPERVVLTIYAAASLKTALSAVTPSYEASHPGTTLSISTDSSAALETQIEQGAPADVFLSADTANPKKLVDAGLAAGSAVAFAGNTLTIIVPTANPGDIRSPADLARPGIKVIAAGESVPITRYAEQLVANLAMQPGYPPGFATAYAANIVSREDNVKAVVAKVELGEGDAGIVYLTDARTSSATVTVPVPDSANVPATYDGVVVAASHQAAAATAFLAWLAGPDGQAVLARFGFLPPT